MYQCMKSQSLDQQPLKLHCFFEFMEHRLTLKEEIFNSWLYVSSKPVYLKFQPDRYF